MSEKILKAIRSLSTIAIIEGRGKLRDAEVVFYNLMDGEEPGAERAALASLDLEIEYHHDHNRSYVVLRDRKRSSSRRLSKSHVLLFLATVLTTLVAGAFLNGYNVLQEPGTIIQGWPFSLTLLAILGVHESGHYFYARRHRVDVSPPYFIPAPPPIFLFGTFGAVIKMRGPIPNRRALLEIGAAGPIAGFLLAVPALFVGLYLSSVTQIDNGGYILGDSLLMKVATALMFPGLGPNEDVLLHPVGIAAWIGILVTMLNLLPIAQLDGGHISYALLGDRQVLLGRVILFILIPMGIFLSPNWLFWGLLIMVLMRTVKHPPVPDINKSLTTRELLLGFVCLVIFILSFIPVPFRLA